MRERIRKTYQIFSIFILYPPFLKSLQYSHPNLICGIWALQKTVAVIYDILVAGIYTFLEIISFHL